LETGSFGFITYTNHILNDWRERKQIGKCTVRVKSGQIVQFNLIPMSFEDVANENLSRLKKLVSEVSSPDVNRKLTYEWDAENRIIRIRFKSTDRDPREYLGFKNFANLMLLKIRFLDLSFWLGKPYNYLWWETVFTAQQKNPLTKDVHFKASESVLGVLGDVEDWELAGRYEQAAQFYEVLGLFKKAGELRRKGKTQYVISTKFEMGKDGVIKIQCPYCGASQPAESKSGEVTCKYCGKTYIIPKKILDMI